MRTATHLSLGFQHFRGVPAPLVTTGTVGKSSMTHKRKVTSNKHIPRQHIYIHLIIIILFLSIITYYIFLILSSLLQNSATRRVMSYHRIRSRALWIADGIEPGLPELLEDAKAPSLGEN